jgi:hypothetical protein
MQGSRRQQTAGMNSASTPTICTRRRDHTGASFSARLSVNTPQQARRISNTAYTSAVRMPQSYSLRAGNFQRLN